jgi:hypothetical protein
VTLGPGLSLYAAPVPAAVALATSGGREVSAPGSSTLFMRPSGGFMLVLGVALGAADPKSAPGIGVITPK